MTEASVSILGCRGIPAAHGGFETVAEQLALHLVRRGWAVTVYCQVVGSEPTREVLWRGIRRVLISVPSMSAWSTILFDLKSVWHALRERGAVLTLGYNTALFNLAFRLKRRVNLINMDGMEWKRQKWSFLERAWLYLNERLACLAADYLVADHPAIAEYLERPSIAHKLRTIPYGASIEGKVDAEHLKALGLSPYGYALVVARPEPENSLLEIVRAYSAEPRRFPLVVLGSYHPADNDFKRAVVQAAGSEVIFPGAIYDKDLSWTLRTYARCYIHGHRVGGTNPSLVEALAAGNLVLAHRNPFNRWVAGDAAWYFGDEEECAQILRVLMNPAVSFDHEREQAWRRHANLFELGRMKRAYEGLLLEAVQAEPLPVQAPRPVRRATAGSDTSAPPIPQPQRRVSSFTGVDSR